MIDKQYTVEEAAQQLADTERIGREARRATRWFRIFVIAQATYALAFTLSIDVADVPYWKAFAPFALVTISIWMIAVRYRRSVPRNGFRNMGIALCTWFALYTLMFDPALQLVGASSPWWWVLAGVVAVAPILACVFASSRR
ncbi:MULTISPECIES: hypothetical protein [Microbacterium]|jgi:hypothetical protein|uniref:hypothetical protein n=1 Tax=Microbacterium TaxID=33882 RepID=UPI000A1DB227|nr:MULTISPECIES: hypothetical protein [Microbacterium]MPT15831.1 hypothetical protein [Microbacterium sp.]OSP07478.1 hypothetical protein B7W94_07660 [Microbacterium sp. LEMMJ01]RUQ05843.1 hypothetical protein D8M34_09170 [Microbacterium sp. HSID17254]